MHSNTSLSRLRRAIWIKLFLALVLLAPLLLPLCAQTANYRVLHSFTGPTSDGRAPSPVLVESDGTIYGTTVEGGSAYNGTAFKLSPKGKETVLYNFNAGYGSWPGLLLPWKGELYGATYQGGAYAGGAAFRLDKEGDEFVLYSFPGRSTGPALSLVDENGVFYGTTDWGGLYGYGSVFEMDSSGKVTTLYSFTGGGLPQNPCCLARDAEGNLYGFTTYPSNGTVFKLDPAGALTTLYAFTGGADGASPSAGPILDESGNLYGGTGVGGDLDCWPPYGCGIIFMLDTSGNEKVLYSFTGPPDGQAPGSLIRDDAGTLYGTTSFGGDAHCFVADHPGCGVVFSLDASGKESVLHAFTSSPDGAWPLSVVMGVSGDLYGTTYTGGDSTCDFWGWPGCGTVFRLGR
jgi:uncharacterized repeat protein (TIGR03803 family)